MEDRSDLGLPGWDLPLEQHSHLPLASEWFASPLTVRERTMLALMGALKNKSNWDRKVFDEEIVAKWRQEAMEYTPDRTVPATDAEDANDPRQSSRENGENINFDGEQRQKKISERMFDHVRVSSCNHAARTMLIQAVHC